MSLALGSDIYKHRLAERSPRNTYTHYNTEMNVPRLEVPINSIEVFKWVTFKVGQAGKI